MDHLLLDIKNFLEKLETGQLEIEAGQWELHKDLSNMRETIEEMRKLKEDVEEMKLNNVEAMELIKGLENKLEGYKTIIAKYKPTVSETSDDYEEVYSARTDKLNNSKVLKKRKCHRIVSEKIVEITSDVDSNQSENQEKSSSSPEFSRKKMKNVLSKSHHDRGRAQSDHSCLQKKQRTRKPDGAIMERYLNDAAKYRHRGSSHSSEKKKPAVCDSICTSTVRPQPVHGAYWDDLSRKKSQRSESKRIKSSKKIPSKGSVLPKLFSCPRCPKSFALKNKFLRHLKSAHDNSNRQFYCRTCKKFYDQKGTLKNHVCLQFTKSKSKPSKMGTYRCSYCNKISMSPEELTSHIKRCRIISNANRKTK